MSLNSDGFADADNEDEPIAVEDNALTIDGVSYTFPLGGATVTVGDSADGSTLFSTACEYGSFKDAIADCANVNAGLTENDAAIGASYDFGNGFTVALGFANGDETGVFSSELIESYSLEAAYTADIYGVAVTYASVEEEGSSNTNWSLNGYYTPVGTSLPSISVGYEVRDGPVGVTDDSSFFVGWTFEEVGPGSAGVEASVGNLGLGSATTNDGEAFQYEAAYSYPVNDGMTITPTVYIKEGTNDTTGLMVKTSFSFFKKAFSSFNLVKLFNLLRTALTCPVVCLESFINPKFKIS